MNQIYLRLESNKKSSKNKNLTTRTSTTITTTSTKTMTTTSTATPTTTTTTSTTTTTTSTTFSSEQKLFHLGDIDLSENAPKWLNNFRSKKKSSRMSFVNWQESYIEKLQAISICDVENVEEIYEVGKDFSIQRIPLTGSDNIRYQAWSGTINQWLKSRFQRQLAYSEMTSFACILDVCGYSEGL